MRRAFTLIELMVAITILSILMVFLYKSYADLNHVNKSYAKAVQTLNREALTQQTVYLDLLLANKKSIIVQKRDKNFDFISFESKHSIHRRINPYIAYIVKEKVLYRLESLEQIKSWEIDSNIPFDIDRIGSVKKFKLYPTRDNKKELYLLDMEMPKSKQLLLKIKVLN
jgi:prepilin-type N-terminal cleavage/methylation domain-containing protein